MKNSGGRAAFHIYSLFFLALFGTFLAVCGFFIMLITLSDPNGNNVRSDWANNFTLDFSDCIIFMDASPTVKQTGIELLQDNRIGLQILDSSGNEVYAYQRPDNARDYYSDTDLLRLNQTGHSDAEDVTSFVGIVTEGGKDYVYLLHFPMNIQKVTMYLNGERFTGGKRIIFFTAGILFTAVIFLGLAYGVFTTNTIRKLVMSVQDISERRYLPVKAKGAFGDLHHSLNGLDAEVRASDKLREETESLRREFISNITHDLKTPLSPIKGYAEIMHGDAEITSAQCKRYAGIMLRNAAYMENLIDDLKLTWQLENGMFPVNRQEQNIVRFLRELFIDILNRPAYESRSILFECMDETVLLSFDTKLFMRMFQNLIINAFVHGGTISVSSTTGVGTSFLILIPCN